MHRASFRMHEDHLCDRERRQLLRDSGGQLRWVARLRHDLSQGRLDLRNRQHLQGPPGRLYPPELHHLGRRPLLWNRGGWVRRHTRLWNDLSYCGMDLRNRQHLQRRPNVRADNVRCTERRSLLRNHRGRMRRDP
jgi:hypothetical protein